MSSVTDLRSIIGPDAPALLHEFAEILSARLQARIRFTRNHTEAMIHQTCDEHFQQHIEAGQTHVEAVEQMDAALRPWVEEIIAGQNAVIAGEEERFREAVRTLLFWWSFTSWNPANRRGYTADVNDPEPIGDSIEEILQRVLPEQVAQGRIRLLREHADAVLALRDLHRKVWEERLGREVRLLVMDGIGPRTAEVAAANNLAARKRELDAELEEGLQRLAEELSRKVSRLVEDAEDEGLISPMEDQDQAR